MAPSRERHPESGRPGTRSRLILDSGAVIAIARRDARAKALLEQAVEAGAEILIPAVVVAETVRGDGPRDAPVNRIISTVDSVHPTDERSARRAGKMLGRSRSSETIDALVVAAAIDAGGGHVLTTDPRDLRGLARGEASVAIHAV